MGYVLLVGALVFNACANILMKVGASRFAGLRNTGVSAAVLHNWPLLLGIFLFALNVVLYALALSRIPLSIGYPIMAVGGLAIITTVSALYLGETITLVQLTGLLLLAGGIVLVAYK